MNLYEWMVKLVAKSLAIGGKLLKATKNRKYWRFMIAQVKDIEEDL